MKTLMKLEPEKYCLRCGIRLDRKRFNGRLEDYSVFLRRKFCGLECAYVSSRKESVSLSGLRKRATKLKALACEKCGSTHMLGIHHKDRDPSNNLGENLSTLCASCHTKLHWQEGKRKIQEKKLCSVVNCLEVVKGHGYCMKHYKRWKKYGNPLLKKILGKNPRIVADYPPELTGSDSSGTAVSLPPSNSPGEPSVAG